MLKPNQLDRALKHEQLLDRAKDRREPATGEPDGEAGAPNNRSTPEAAPTGEALTDEPETLGPNQSLESNLNALARNPKAAIRAFGVEWAGWCAASALKALATHPSAPVAPIPAAVDEIVPVDEASSLMKLIRAAHKSDPVIAEAYGGLLADRMDEAGLTGRYVRQFLEVLRGERAESFVHPAAAPAVQPVAPASEAQCGRRKRDGESLCAQHAKMAARCVDCTRPTKDAA